MYLIKQTKKMYLINTLKKIQNINDFNEFQPSIIFNLLLYSTFYFNLLFINDKKNFIICPRCFLSFISQRKTFEKASN